MRFHPVTRQVIGAAIEVHKAMGSGLLESIYQECLEVELRLRRVRFERQKTIPLTYKGVEVGAALRLDLLVGNTVIVEIKAVESITPVHEAQLVTYLRLTGCSVGLLINFNVEVLRKGGKRMINYR